MQTKGKKTRAGILAPVRDLASQSVIALKKAVETESTAALKAELSRLLGFSAENLLRLAIITSELEKRGEDLSSIKFGLLPLLRKIACGELLPEIVVMFAGQPAALRRIAAMEKGEQAAIASGKKVFSWLESEERQPQRAQRSHGATKKPGFVGYRNPRTRPEHPETSRAENEAETCEAIFHAENLLRLIKANLVLKTDRAESVLSDLLRAIAKRSGTLPAEEIQRRAARFIGDAGRCALSVIADEVGVTSEVLEPLLNHRWFTKTADGYYLSTSGRREID